tara:strand:- start:437 stop:835 length:399 start_codon:yes stop_codon:yes gene_type:complete
MDLEIFKIASDTEYNKDISKHTHKIKLKNSMCGDEIQIKLIIKKNKILDFGYQGDSCVYCQASASLLSKTSIQKDKDKINELCDDAELFFDKKNKTFTEKWVSFKKLFKKDNLSRKDCILLPFKALKRIVTN